MQTLQGRTIHDFIVALRANHVHDVRAQQEAVEDPTAFDWVQLGEGVSHLFRSAPGVGCMLGPLDAAPKARKAPAPRQAKQPLAAMVRPDELAQIDESEKQETDRNMEEMWKALSQRGEVVPVPELVCNHRSFSQTIENLFTLAFLVRDRRVRLQRDRALGVVVRVLERPAGSAMQVRGGAVP